MPGYKEFSSGERLFASDVNDYLSKQTVMRFADASARDTALSGALREGMVAYLDDTDEVLAYDGTAWGSLGLPLGTATPTDGQILAFGTATSTWNPTDGGKLVAVKHALFTGTQTNSTAAGADFAVTDLSITHALSSASNKLIISAYLGAAASSYQRAEVGLAVADDGTPIGRGASAGNRTLTGSVGRVGSTSNITVLSPSVTFVYEPGDTASHTFTVRAINPREGTATIYINRTEDDSNLVNRPRASSGFVIQEVKA